MDPVQAIVLAIVQGLSEFLPISSSGHLILLPHFLGWSYQCLAFAALSGLACIHFLIRFIERIASMRAARTRSAMIGPASRASTCGSSLTAAAAARACRSRSACG